MIDINTQGFFLGFLEKVGQLTPYEASLILAGEEPKKKKKDPRERVLQAWSAVSQLPSLMAGGLNFLTSPSMYDMTKLKARGW